MGEEDYRARSGGDVVDHHHPGLLVRGVAAGGASIIAGRFR